MQDEHATPLWQRLAEQKRQSLNSMLPPSFQVKDVLPPTELKNALTISRQFLTKEEIDITENYTAQALCEKLALGKFSAVKVTEAFCHRATIAHQLVNCLSEVLFSKALTRAKELDDYLQKNGKPVGPLHGLPISLKDQFRVKETETSLGYVAWLGNKETEQSESWLVKALRDMGAIIFVKTNAPTSLMSIETNNNIIGYTTNPHNRLLSAGGSSGGEAALLAMRGSLVGLGSDIAGSIRIPCSFNGLAGLKPSHGRIPYLNVANSMEGHESVHSVIGPMGHSISDLRFVLKTILRSEPWIADPKVINFPWRQDEEDRVTQKVRSKRLSFGVLKWDEIVKPHPPVQRAVEETVEALKAQGYNVVDLFPPSHSEAHDLLRKIITIDGGTDIHQNLTKSGEPPVAQLAVTYGQRLGELPVGTVNELWAIQQQKYSFQERYLKFWNSCCANGTSYDPIDAIIAPVAPTVSYKPSSALYLGYTGVYNLLDFATAVVPATYADQEKDPLIPDYTPVSDFDAAIWRQYDPDVFHGIPVGVQIVCRRLEEEKVLAVAEEVEKVLRDR